MTPPVPPGAQHIPHTSLLEKGITLTVHTVSLSCVMQAEYSICSDSIFSLHNALNSGKRLKSSVQTLGSRKSFMTNHL